MEGLPAAWTLIGAENVTANDRTSPGKYVPVLVDETEVTPMRLCLIVIAAVMIVLS